MWQRIAGRHPWAYVDQAVLKYYCFWGTSVSQTYPPEHGEPLVNAIYDEGTMKQLVRPEMWRGYRIFRREQMLQMCSGYYGKLSPSDYRLILGHIVPAPLSFTWFVWRVWVRLPAILQRPMIAIGRYGCKVLRRIHGRFLS